MNSDDIANDVAQTHSDASPTSPNQLFNLNTIIDKAIDAAVQPKNLYALGATALLPLLKRAGRFASKHPVMTAAFVGTAVIGFFLFQGDRRIEERILH